MRVELAFNSYICHGWAFDMFLWGPPWATGCCAFGVGRAGLDGTSRLLPHHRDGLKLIATTPVDFLVLSQRQHPILIISGGA